MPFTNAVLFQTHFFDHWAAVAFRKLCAGLPADHRATVLIHLPPDAPVPARLHGVPHHVVRTPDLRDPVYPTKSSGVDWSLWAGGHTDLIALHFFRAHPHFAAYWVVEYDVRFSGPWRRLFAEFADDETDFLATCLVRRGDDPGWYNWPSLSAPEPVAEEHALRAFMPIFRATGRAMRAMDEAYRAGWGGHAEATWATVTRARGLTVADIGGQGEFTPPHRRGRFYSSTPAAELLAPGTMVFKPTFLRAGTRRDMLWHPVKPFWWRAELRSGMREMRSVAGRVLRAAVPWALPRRWRVPGGFSATVPASADTPALSATSVTATAPRGDWPLELAPSAEPDRAMAKTGMP